MKWEMRSKKSRKCDELLNFLEELDLNNDYCDKRNAACNGKDVAELRIIGRGVLKEIMKTLCINNEDDTQEVNLTFTKTHENSQTTDNTAMWNNIWTYIHTFYYIIFERFKRENKLGRV